MIKSTRAVIFQKKIIFGIAISKFSILLSLFSVLFLAIIFIVLNGCSFGSADRSVSSIEQLLPRLDGFLHALNSNNFTKVRDYVSNRISDSEFQIIVRKVSKMNQMYFRALDDEEYYRKYGSFPDTMAISHSKKKYFPVLYFKNYAVTANTRVPKDLREIKTSRQTTEFVVDQDGKVTILKGGEPTIIKMDSDAEKYTEYLWWEKIGGEWYYYSGLRNISKVDTGSILGDVIGSDYDFRLSSAAFFKRFDTASERVKTFYPNR